MAQAVFRQKGPSSYPWKSGLHSTLKDFANKGETIKLDTQIWAARTSESQSLYNKQLLHVAAWSSPFIGAQDPAILDEWSAIRRLFQIPAA
jgi:hypothetical protein